MTHNNSQMQKLLTSFIFGFIFILVLILILSAILVTKYDHLQKSQEYKVPFTTYFDENYSLSYPENYELHINKIVATEGIVEEKENTIHLISPTIPNTDGNLSIIFSHEPYESFQEAAMQGSTCAELHGMELEEIQIGENTFTQSGLINCGPNEVAFFYTVNGEEVYEAKVETTAEYETEALPIIKRILKTLRFN